MAAPFEIPADTRTIVAESLKAVYDFLGKRCRLVYPHTWTDCTNCVSHQVGNRSVSHWRSGGPVFFPDGASCPVCGGQGKRAHESSEEISLVCEWEPKKFILPLPSVDVRVPYGLLQTKGEMVHLPKVVRCDHLVVDLPMESLVRARYHLAGEPFDKHQIAQGKFFTALWERGG